MSTVHVEATKAYDVVIGSGILDRIGEMSTELTASRKAVIVSGERVFPLYGETVRRSLEAAGFEVISFVHESGERAKSLESFGKLLNFLCDSGVTRSDVLFALGGGVTGDLTGFAAASYQRGMDCVQIPTTLLAMADSSVGGKTAINLDGGKNMAGAFHQPAAVFCDTEVLKTLPQEEYSNGCAEIVKCGVLNAELFSMLKVHGIRGNEEQVITACVELKRDIVQADEFDRGRRRLLNLGHTLAHAIEKFADFSVPHGRAVAMGLAVMTGHDAQVCAMLESCGLPTSCPYSKEELCKLMISDKKRQGDTVTLAIPREIGNCELVEVPVDGLENAVFGGRHE